MSYQQIYKNYRTLILSFVAITYPIITNALTLNDAIIIAHENNYKILAEQQNFEAVKMQKPKAYSDLLPNVYFNNTNYHQTYKNPAVRDIKGSPYYRQYGLNISQPLFNGGATFAKIKIADKSVESGLARFNNVSNEITANSVQAYEGVLTYREIYEINVKNHKVFEKNLEFTKIRFDVGVVTRTDVLQTELRLANATAQKEKAYADMKNSEAYFMHVMGVAPDSHLEQIDLTHIVVPSSIDELLEIANGSNPGLHASRIDSKAAKYQVNVAASQMLPTVSANAQLVRSSDSKLPNNSLSSTSGNTYTLQVQVPIFQGGAEYADIKQKKHLANKAKLDSQEAERQLTESCITVWNNYKTVKSVILARLNAIDAASQALKGVEEEVNVGTRTTLDLLNAEKELFDAKVGHRLAKQDLVNSVYQMLQVMGKLSVSNPNDV